MLLRSYIAAWQSQYRLKSSEFLVPIPDAAERLWRVLGAWLLPAYRVVRLADEMSCVGR